MALSCYNEVMDALIRLESTNTPTNHHHHQLSNEIGKAEYLIHRFYVHEGTRLSASDVSEVEIDTIGRLSRRYYTLAVTHGDETALQELTEDTVNTLDVTYIMDQSDRLFIQLLERLVDKFPRGCVFDDWSWLGESQDPFEILYRNQTQRRLFTFLMDTRRLIHQRAAVNGEKDGTYLTS